MSDRQLDNSVACLRPAWSRPSPAIVDVEALSPKSAIRGTCKNEPISNMQSAGSRCRLRPLDAADRNALADAADTVERIQPPALREDELALLETAGERLSARAFDRKLPDCRCASPSRKATS